MAAPWASITSEFLTVPRRSPLEATWSNPTAPAGWACIVKNSDVIEAQEAALKNICAVRVLAVHPPGEIQEQLVKNFLEESTIGDATHAALDFVDAPGGPGMNRWIHIAKGPFVGG